MGDLVAYVRDGAEYSAARSYFLRQQKGLTTKGYNVPTAEMRAIVFGPPLDPETADEGLEPLTPYKAISDSMLGKRGHPRPEELAATHFESMDNAYKQGWEHQGG